LPYFPKKRFLGRNTDPKFVQKRCVKITFYLNEIAKLPGVMDVPAVTEFLNTTIFSTKGETEGNEGARDSNEEPSAETNLEQTLLEITFTGDCLERSHGRRDLRELFSSMNTKLMEAGDEEKEEKKEE